MLAPSANSGRIQLQRTRRTTLSDWSFPNIALAAVHIGRIGRCDEETRTAVKKPVFPRISDYVRGVVSELRKVVWPAREERRRLTVMVIVISAAVGLFLGAIDYGFTHLTRLFLGG